ncbi:unnamed protein product [Sphagnum jensenii]|uniref:peptidyl-tRNA hydrolase n=1 Tax=Sphagnum jensenii TaxID=128206 RepID=A0ABP0V704_9BRYO
MNDSGECVAPLMKFHKSEPGDLVVIYDELDLKPLQMRIKTGGGSGGHNGIKSIDQCLGSELTDYHRVRIGIGHPARGVHPSAQNTHARSVVDYVLQNFTDDELAELDKVLDDVTAATELLIRGDATRAMTAYNKRDN